MSKPKVIARIKGGLGNQLFCYATARRLALKNGVELVLDHKTGFSRDRKYRREYELDHFKLPCRKATPAERLKPFERYRRGILKLIARRKEFRRRNYIEQGASAYDPRLLELDVNRTVYLDGYWQSEDYFKDVANQIRQDLQMAPPQSSAFDDCLHLEIGRDDSVVLHVRFFRGVHKGDPAYGRFIGYYRSAVEEVERRIGKARYFLFSDYPDAAMELVGGILPNVVVVRQHGQSQSPYADLWLMSQSRNLILANSTFSWWASWLAEGRGSNVVICPDTTLIPNVEWGFVGLIPPRWIRIKVEDA